LGRRLGWRRRRRSARRSPSSLLSSLPSDSLLSFFLSLLKPVPRSTVRKAIRTLLLLLAAGCLLYEGLRVSPSLSPSLLLLPRSCLDEARPNTPPSFGHHPRHQSYKSSSLDSSDPATTSSSSSSPLSRPSGKPTFPPPVFTADVEKRDAVREAFVVSLPALSLR